MFDFGKITQNVLATFGAIILSTTAIAAAVGPARAAETAPIHLAAAQVSGQVNA